MIEVQVRRAAPVDAEALLQLFAEHADYEGANATLASPERLVAALFGPNARALAWLAEDRSGPIGYAIGAVEFSAWSATEFMHLDCLFLRSPARGGGVGARLLTAVAQSARTLGIREMQWWTPGWNARGAGFYRRQGAVGSKRLRFNLALR
jgi:GNAT superfamily N-acetyltransferase